MKTILRTRKTVQCYVWYNLGMALLSLIIGYVIALLYNPETSNLWNEITNNGKVMAITIGVLVLTTVAFIGVFWLFYRLLYGILLRRLYANYKELKNINQHDTCYAFDYATTHNIPIIEFEFDLEDFIKEATCPECHKDPCECDDEKDVKESMFAQFEEWAEATEQGKLTDDEVEALKTAMSELPNAELELGPDGQTAWQFFSGLGLTDSDLEDKFKAASELDQSADPIEVLKMWAQESYPELLVLSLIHI